MESVHERIRKSYEQLTNQQKLVAKYILDEPNQVALHPAKVIGANSGTSETTVIRLCYSLGYSGFSELQNELRQMLLFPVIREGVVQSFHDAAYEFNDSDDVISFTMEQDVSFIQKTLNGLDRHLFDQATQSIVKAKKIIIVGGRTSFAPAYWLSFALNIIKGDTHLYRGQIDDANQLISEITEDWLMIALVFPRYLQDTLSFAKAAKEKGSKILVITDHELSPLGPVADVLLKVTTPPPATLRGMSSIFTLLNALVSGVSQIDQERVKKRIQRYDKSSEHFYPFVQES
ncbi:MurR/RpiR family transcriptional regulator [Brevibacillus choshinensis]|uniref:MurR/RpiR family transcriptional regulator n=1 Tax=Brevibacillus choshinensis TaxID=54911 RepID=UPI002E1A6B13|nr:MurR/RpiR family transcriptional regulator [Brevibacillus choshinensis]MED4785213.1 MurR/RpiR family transcriptional regulator [Brevibacillus choshinensis]